MILWLSLSRRKEPIFFPNFDRSTLNYIYEILWLKVFSSRFLCSSRSGTLRRWSNIRVTTYSIPIVVLCVGLLYIHIPIYYVILPLQVCFVPKGIYRTFLSIWYLVVWSWCPSVAMLVFGLLTVQHIHQGKNRVIPQNSQNDFEQNQRKTNKQLIRMVLF